MHLTIFKFLKTTVQQKETDKQTKTERKNTHMGRVTKRKEKGIKYIWHMWVYQGSKMDPKCTPDLDNCTIQFSATLGCPTPPKIPVFHFADHSLLIIYYSNNFYYCYYQKHKDLRSNWKPLDPPVLCSHWSHLAKLFSGDLIVSGKYLRSIGYHGNVHR